MNDANTETGPKQMTRRPKAALSYSARPATGLHGRGGGIGGTIAVMPLDLTDAELATAATACRAMAYQEGERAKNMENATLRAPLETNARRYAALAEKLEAARIQRPLR